jgi:hypothetical protein
MTFFPSVADVDELSFRALARNPGVDSLARSQLS